MKLSERLLEILDAKAAADRAQISEQASDIDALGEIVSGAHYDGIELRPERIHAQGDSILVTCRTPEAALAWLLRSGFSVQSTESSDRYVHHRLTHPRLLCPVVILTTRESGVHP